MVSGGRARGWSRGSWLPPSQSARGWGTQVCDSAVTDGDPQVYFAGGGWSGALARVQRCRLPESAGVREWALLGKSHRAKDRDGESGERESVGGGLVFSESGGTECGRGHAAKNRGQDRRKILPRFFAAC